MVMDMHHEVVVGDCLNINHMFIEMWVAMGMVGSLIMEMLLLFTRNYNSNPKWRLVAWLTYNTLPYVVITILAAMVAAIHMECSPDNVTNLYALWAPILLLQLGMPHNLSAYSGADAELWARHCIIMVLHSAFALYIVISINIGLGAMANEDNVASRSNKATYMLLPSILTSSSLLVSGIAKYAERVLALRWASKSALYQSSLPIYEFMRLEPWFVLNTSSSPPPPPPDRPSSSHVDPPPLISIASSGHRPEHNVDTTSSCSPMPNQCSDPVPNQCSDPVPNQCSAPEPLYVYNYLLAGEVEWYRRYLLLATDEAPEDEDDARCREAAEHTPMLVTLHDVLSCKELRTSGPIPEAASRHHRLVQLTCVAFSLFKLYRRRLAGLYMYEWRQRQKTPLFFLGGRIMRSEDEILSVLDMEVRFLYESLYTKSAHDAGCAPSDCMRVARIMGVLWMWLRRISTILIIGVCITTIIVLLLGGDCASSWHMDAFGQAVGLLCSHNTNENHDVPLFLDRHEGRNGMEAVESISAFSYIWLTLLLVACVVLLEVSRLVDEAVLSDWAIVRMACTLVRMEHKMKRISNHRELIVNCNYNLTGVMNRPNDYSLKTLWKLSYLSMEEWLAKLVMVVTHKSMMINHSMRSILRCRKKFSTYTSRNIGQHTMIKTTNISSTTTSIINHDNDDHGPTGNHLSYNLTNEFQSYVVAKVLESCRNTREHGSTYHHTQPVTFSSAWIHHLYVRMSSDQHQLCLLAALGNEQYSDFENLLVNWHIATCVCELLANDVDTNNVNLIHVVTEPDTTQEYPSDNHSNVNIESREHGVEIMRKMSNRLSRYMAFLLFHKTELLPCHPHVGRELATETQQALHKVNCSPEYLSSHVLNRIGTGNDHEITNANVIPYRVRGGMMAAKRLLEIVNVVERWGLILELWVEILICAACAPNKTSEHLHHLTLGGQFLTNIWVLLGHMGLGDK